MMPPYSVFMLHSGPLEMEASFQIRAGRARLSKMRSSISVDIPMLDPAMGNYIGHQMIVLFLKRQYDLLVFVTRDLRGFALNCISTLTRILYDHLLRLRSLIHPQKYHQLMKRQARPHFEAIMTLLRAITL